MSSSHDLFNAYALQVSKLTETFRSTQFTALDQASDIIVEAYQNKKRFMVFGSGHSHMVAEEFYARAGGLAYVTPVLQNELTLTDHPLKSTLIERTLGMAHVYFELYHMEAGDVLLVCSNSGRNALPVELARLAKEKGLSVIAFVNAQQAMTIGSRHPSGKNLPAFADLVIDNCGAYGDAGFDLGEGIMMGSTSTIIGALMAQSLSILVASKIKALGLAIPVFRSSNLDGADEYNAELIEHYCKTF